MGLASILLLPFAGALLVPLMARAGRGTAAATAAGFNAAALLGLLMQAPAVFAGAGPVLARAPWVPALGLDLHLFLDPLGFLMALLILGIGLLILLYARAYLAPEDSLPRLLGLLLLFQGAMLGIALSDNLLLLLVFWELTSLASFLLIGFWRGRADARRGARMALAVTGGGGLALIGGLLLLGAAAGSTDLTGVLAAGDEVRASPLYLPALLLVLLGAFTKSAQFPFHFWLPHAMAAPTPVSAYLHSATMVKAGVFLLARLWPVLSGTDAWTGIVAPVGLVTALAGAWFALHQTDLKGLLAHSTVSHLGLMTMLLGLGTPVAAMAALLHLLSHAAFKATLFMTAGIVDHAAGTRDIRRLGGLAAAMPVTAGIALVAAAAMAGLPPLNGFVSKEAMLDSALADGGWAMAALATAAALLSAAYAARFAFGTFLGPPPPAGSGAAAAHDPPPGLWLPPAALLVPVVLLGLFPGALAWPLVGPAARAAVGPAGAAALEGEHLALWHGATPALLLSALALLGGLGLHAALTRGALDRPLARLPSPEGRAAHDAALAALGWAAGALVARVQGGSLPGYLGAILAVTLAVAFAAFGSAPLAPGDRPLLPVTPVALVGWLVVLGCCAAVVRRHGNRLLALLLTGAVGLMVSLAFLHFSAPDLALTQISVEVVTTVLLLLALNFLPKTTPPERRSPRVWGHALLAGLAGLGAAAGLWAVLTRDLASPVAAYYLETSKTLGGGANVVNVILVDFRGYDTFGEITVLAIAALAIVALLDSAVRGEAGRRLRGAPRPVQAAEAHPLVLVVATRVLLPFGLVVAAHLLLRGHNEPGGGFIAGLVVGVALIVQYMASGYGWAARRLRLDQHALVGAGLLVAGLTGAGAWLAGEPFLTSQWNHFHIPILGELELATAALFDLGVFLTVVGVVMLSLAGLARIGAAAEPPDAGPGPMDVPLRAAGRGAGRREVVAAAGAAVARSPGVAAAPAAAR